MRAQPVRIVRATSLFLVTLFLSIQTPLAAQEPGADAKPRTTPAPPATAARHPNDVVHRVPDFFGQVGLTPDQREQIYKLREDHFQKIQALEKQIAEARAAMLVDCEKVLTSTQKELLLARRKAAEERRTKRLGTARTGPSGDATPKKPGQ